MRRPARRTDAAGGRMAPRMRGRGGARRKHRAASAPQTQARRRRRNKAVRRRPGRAHGTREHDESSESAAGFRKRRERPTRGCADAKAAGGEGNLAIAEPPWRKAQRAPALEPRPPETGRASPPHTHDTLFFVSVDFSVDTRHQVVKSKYDSGHRASAMWSLQ